MKDLPEIIKFKKEIISNFTTEELENFHTVELSEIGIVVKDLFLITDLLEAAYCMLEYRPLRDRSVKDYIDFWLSSKIINRWPIKKEVVQLTSAN